MRFSFKSHSIHLTLLCFHPRALKERGTNMIGIDIRNVYNYPWPRMIKGNLPIQVLGEFGVKYWR